MTNRDITFVGDAAPNSFISFRLALIPHATFVGIWAWLGYIPFSLLK